ncbi:hypothetical protein A7982_12952 [Minicystis rosea]|nr:hypothetical protein A7982_12952 [Minicystis rosea]
MVVHGGPYRLTPASPETVARLDEARSAALGARRVATRAQRRLTWLAAGGYLAAALAATPSEGDRSGRSRTAAWTCMAAGATYALFLAGRAGGRAHDLEAEIAGIDQLAEALSRTPRA